MSCLPDIVFPLASENRPLSGFVDLSKAFHWKSVLAWSWPGGVSVQATGVSAAQVLSSCKHPAVPDTLTNTALFFIRSSSLLVSLSLDAVRRLRTTPRGLPKEGRAGAHSQTPVSLVICSSWKVTTKRLLPHAGPQISQ